jgi:GNAT superfamily N-acetyltransferase
MSATTTRVPVIRPARPEDATHLSALALRSKRHWGYDDAFLSIVRSELSVTPEQTRTHRVMLLEDDGRVLGFYGLGGAPPDADLTWLFVEPDAIGAGYGRALWRHAVHAARSSGFATLVIESDPFAEGFYLAMGAHRVGEIASRFIAGRVLPLLKYDL